MKKTASDNFNESDGQMVIRIAKKFVLIFFFIFLFDSILDLFFAVLDIVFEVIHIIFEFFEYSLELLLEHFLNSNHYQSEVIIVNFVILITLYGFFRLCFKLPRLYTWISRHIKAAWLKRKRKNHFYWKSLPLIRKTEIILTYCIGLFCILFFLTL